MVDWFVWFGSGWGKIPDGCYQYLDGEETHWNVACIEQWSSEGDGLCIWVKELKGFNEGKAGL